MCTLKFLSPTWWPCLHFSTMSGSPAAARNVGIQSWCWTISLDTDAGLDLAGPADQLGDRGRRPPSWCPSRCGTAWSPRRARCSCAGRCRCCRSTIVSSARPSSSSGRATGRRCGRGRSSCRGTATASGRPGRCSPAWCGCAGACGWCSSTRRTACRPRAGGGSSRSRPRSISSSIVSIRFFGQRTGVLDALLAERPELRVVLAGVLVGGPRVDHARGSWMSWSTG